MVIPVIRFAAPNSCNDQLPAFHGSVNHERVGYKKDNGRFTKILIFVFYRHTGCNDAALSEGGLHMKKIKLEILGISYSQSQSGAYALIFGEAGKKRRLPIIIGSFEAQAIAIELEKMKPSRPLTHDLFKNFATTFNVSITEVIIYKFSEGIFFAKLICFDGIKEVEIDSRTSDAVAIAVRFKCPIYTYENILSAAGIVMQEGDESLAAEGGKTGKKKKEKQQVSKDQYNHMTIKELEKKLMEAIDAEAYEKASVIRDEINKRKRSKK